MIEPVGHHAFDYRLHEAQQPSRIQWYFHDRSRLQAAVQRWELEPGASEGLHAHPPEQPLEELYLVIAGSATLRVDDQTFHAGPGDAVLAPVGSSHDVRNTGDETLQLLVVWGPPGTVDWSAFGTDQAARAAADRSRAAEG